ARDRGHICVMEPEPIVAIDGGRLTRESRPVHGAVQPFAASIPGEHPARPVGPVGSGCKSDDEHARRRVTESRDRTTPVALRTEARHLLRRDLTPVGDQTWAPLAARDGGAELRQVAHSPQRTPAVRKSTCVSRTTPLITAPVPAGSTKATRTPRAAA